MVMDTRLFVSLNPSMSIAQPNVTWMRPAYNNWSIILEQRNLVTSDQVRDCKNRMNTFGFTGDLGSQPEIACVYQNDAAKNYYRINRSSLSCPRNGQVLGECGANTMA